MLIYIKFQLHDSLLIYVIRYKIYIDYLMWVNWYKSCVFAKKLDIICSHTGCNEVVTEKLMLVNGCPSVCAILFRNWQDTKRTGWVGLADDLVALFNSSSNFRVGKKTLKPQTWTNFNAPCTLCETLLARSEILYFLVFSQTELAPSPNKSCQYKVSATQYLPISSVVGGYWVHYLLQLFLLSFNGNLHAKGKSWSLLSLETSFLFFARKLCS